MLPPTVRARVSVEAAVAQGWRDVVGDAGRIVSLEHFGASADYQTLFREFGFTAEHVAAAARESSPQQPVGSTPCDRADPVGVRADVRRHRRPTLSVDPVRSRPPLPGGTS